MPSDGLDHNCWGVEGWFRQTISVIAQYITTLKLLLALPSHLFGIHIFNLCRLKLPVLWSNSMYKCTFYICTVSSVTDICYHTYIVCHMFVFPPKWKDWISLPNLQEKFSEKSMWITYSEGGSFLLSSRQTKNLCLILYTCRLNFLGCFGIVLVKFVVVSSTFWYWSGVHCQEAVQRYATGHSFPLLDQTVDIWWQSVQTGRQTQRTIKTPSAEHLMLILCCCFFHHSPAHHNICLNRWLPFLGSQSPTVAFHQHVNRVADLSL